MMRELQDMSGVDSVVADLCMFGLKVSEKGVSRKPTKFLSNCPEVLELLNVRCDHSHAHVPLEHGLPAKA